MNSTTAVLIGELLVAGIDVMKIMSTANDAGMVPKEAWDEIRAEVERANARWAAAGDRGA